MAIEMTEVKPHPTETYCVGLDDHCMVVSSGANPEPTRPTPGRKPSPTPKVWLSRSMLRWLGTEGLRWLHVAER